MIQDLGGFWFGLDLEFKILPPQNGEPLGKDHGEYMGFIGLGGSQNLESLFGGPDCKDYSMGGVYIGALVHGAKICGYPK